MGGTADRTKKKVRKLRDFLPIPPDALGSHLPGSASPTRADLRDPPPTHDRPIDEHAAGGALAGGDLLETRAHWRRRLTVGVATPADRRAVGAQTAAVVLAHVDRLELVARRRLHVRDEAKAPTRDRAVHANPARREPRGGHLLERTLRRRGAVGTYERIYARIPADGGAHGGLDRTGVVGAHRQRQIGVRRRHICSVPADDRTGRRS